MLPKNVTQGRSQHLRSAMQRLEEQQQRMQAARPSEDVAQVRSGMEHNVLVQALMAIPGAQHIVTFAENAGLIGSLDKLILTGLSLWVLFALMLAKFGFLAVIIAFFLAFFVMFMYIRRRIRKRRALFLNLLPDALEIIVRSIRSGYPINAAIGMVADTLPQEVGSEYLRIMHEASYGYSLGEAVTRFAQRMKEPDVSFFAVVVNLQQETGGNLTETLGNLSAIIRQRQQLKLKIRALSSEGRATVWILLVVGAFMIGALLFINPTHFDIMICVFYDLFGLISFQTIFN